MADQGPFDRILQAEPTRQRDRAAVFIVVISVVLGALLLVLVLPPVSIFDNGGGAGVTGPVTATLRDELPAPPEGFEAVSGLFDLSAEGPVNRPARLTVSLSAPVQENERLQLFTYQDGGWHELGDAIGVAGGESAQGEVPALPSNIAVLRPVEQSRVVLGSLPSQAEPDQRALATITTLNLAGFAPAADGRVSGGPLQLPEGVQLPVAPTIGATSSSDIEVLQSILGSPELLDAHVQAIVEFADQGRLAGIDLDYRTIDPAQGDAFVTFVRTLSTGLRSDGRSLSLTLPLPVRTASGWDTQGFQWETLVPLVDAVKLAPELEQDLYYARVEEALGYLVPRVGSAKLLLAVSPLSRERSADGIRTLSLTDALALAGVPRADPKGQVAPGAAVRALGQNLASDTGASGLHWDDSARAVVFTYTGRGGERTVWLANLFSEAFKLDLAARYQLGGVYVEDVSRQAEDADIWPAVAQYAQTGAVELVKANDALLQPHWAASAGRLESDTGPQVTWHAPAEPGTYTLTLIVSDGVMRVGQELRVPVQPVEGAVSP